MKKTTILIITLFLFLNSVAFAGTTENKALLIAAGSGDLAKVSQLISEGADVNYKTLSGDTALIQASTFHHADVISKLIDNGANVKMQRNDGATALMFASKMRCSHPDIIGKFLANGADVQVKMPNGSTTLIMVNSKACEPKSMAEMQEAFQLPKK